MSTVRHCLATRVLPALLALPAGSAFALNILLCNDDGITAANVRALKTQLAAAGHRVLLSGPIANQSGTGGSVSFLRPIPALNGSERGAVALGLPAGTAGVGSDPGDPDVFYVNGTPVMACLYGIDVQAPKVWGQAPDLVISGPNEGNNTGHINNSSGTFNAMLYAVNRQLPAIAVSDNVTAQLTWSTALPPTSRPFEVADIVVRLVDRLERDEDKHSNAGRRLLPEGLGLNVNVPAFTAGTGAALPLRFTRIGQATAFAPAFYERLSDSPLAVASGVNLPLPGISLGVGGTALPSGVMLPLDASSSSEANAIAAGGAVTVSPVQGVPEASERLLERLRRGSLQGR
ncbi:putative acid phosphatase [Burkholderiales bacterium JOSHI_001]|nr:putative acid phosphatase [Burkholderiales bacterium JOSHI_001]